MENPYQIIKRYVTDGIAAGEWLVGDLLPSEHALCRRFSVSRMTVNRAMRELAQENLIRRVPGKGSYVAERVAQSALLQIRNIADEIRARQGVHRAAVLTLESVQAPVEIAETLESATALHSVILHYENEVPLQVEDRYVAPAAAPGYLDQDFTKITPNAFLMKVAPLTDVEHVVQAIAATQEIAAKLGVQEGAPCLVVRRTTWSHGRPVSCCTLTHPGGRFRLSGHFSAAQDAS